MSRYRVWLALRNPNTPDAYPHSSFDAMAVRILPPDSSNIVRARIWLYIKGANGKYELVEKYGVGDSDPIALQPLRERKQNAPTNLRACCQRNVNGEPQQSYRHFLFTGTEPHRAGGSTAGGNRKAMLRLTTFVTRPNTCEDGKPTTPTGVEDVFCGCEDYPDDEMLEEYDYEYDPGEEDPLEEYDDPLYDDIDPSYETDE